MSRDTSISDCKVSSLRILSLHSLIIWSLRIISQLEYRVGYALSIAYSNPTENKRSYIFTSKHKMLVSPERTQIETDTKFLSKDAVYKTICLVYIHPHNMTCRIIRGTKSSLRIWELCKMIEK